MSEFKVVGRVATVNDRDKNFTAVLDNNTKFSGWRLKKDGGETVIYKKVKDSYASGTTFCWKGKINGEYYNVEFADPIDEADAPAGGAPGPAYDPTPIKPEPGHYAVVPAPQGVWTKPAEQKVKKDIDTFVFGSVCRLAQGGLTSGQILPSDALGYVLGLYEDVQTWAEQS